MAEMSRAKSTVCWVAFVLFATVAIYRFVASSRGPIAEMPDTPESSQAFVCRKCEHVFHLTPRKRAELMSQGGSVERSEVTSVRKLLLPCPACQQVAAVVAGSCAQCGKPYLRTAEDGRRYAQCRDCRTASSSQGRSAPSGAR
ncbi:MAG: hypothetical protein ACYSVY_12615 [Planctomycetota bacterium]